MTPTNMASQPKLLILALPVAPSPLLPPPPMMLLVRTLNGLNGLRGQDELGQAEQAQTRQTLDEMLGPAGGFVLEDQTARGPARRRDGGDGIEVEVDDGVRHEAQHEDGGHEDEQRQADLRRRAADVRTPRQSLQAIAVADTSGIPSNCVSAAGPLGARLKDTLRARIFGCPCTSTAAANARHLLTRTTRAAWNAKRLGGETYCLRQRSGGPPPRQMRQVRDGQCLRLSAFSVAPCRFEAVSSARGVVCSALLGVAVGSDSCTSSHLPGRFDGNAQSEPEAKAAMMRRNRASFQ